MEPKLEVDFGEEPNSVQFIKNFFHCQVLVCVLDHDLVQFSIIYGKTLGDIFLTDEDNRRREWRPAWLDRAIVKHVVN